MFDSIDMLQEKGHKHQCHWTKVLITFPTNQSKHWDLWIHLSFTLTLPKDFFPIQLLNFFLSHCGLKKEKKKAPKNTTKLRMRTH